MAEPTFSIIIPTHSRCEMLAALLQRLRELPGPSHEVIVVDDASSDGTSAMLAGEFPEVRVVRNEVARGFDALPDAVAAARGRFVVQLDDDAYPDEDTLPTLLAHFERRGPKLGLVAMPFVEPQSGRIGYNPYFPPVDSAEDYGPTAGFAAGAVALRREAALEVPMSPPGYFMYETEVPATIEYLRAGWEADFLPSARVFHVWEARREVGKRAAFLALRNDLVTIRRYFRGWRRAEMLLGRYLTGFFHVAASGSPAAVFRAHREAREMLRTRYPVQEEVPDWILDRVYPSFDGLTLLTFFGETNRRRLAWFLGRLPIDQVA